MEPEGGKSNNERLKRYQEMLLLAPATVVRISMKQKEALELLSKESQWRAIGCRLLKPGPGPLKIFWCKFMLCQIFEHYAWLLKFSTNQFA